MVSKIYILIKIAAVNIVGACFYFILIAKLLKESSYQTSQLYCGSHSDFSQLLHLRTFDSFN